MNFGFGHGHHGHHHHHHHHHGHHHHNNGGGLLLGAALLGAVAGAAVAHNSEPHRVVVVGPPAQTVHPASVAAHQARPVQVQVMQTPAYQQPPVYQQQPAAVSAGPAIANCMACRSPIQFQRTGAACQVRCYNCPTINTFY